MQASCFALFVRIQIHSHRYIILISTLCLNFKPVVYAHSLLFQVLPKPVLTLLNLSFPLPSSDLGEEALENEFMLNNLNLSQVPSLFLFLHFCFSRFIAFRKSVLSVQCLSCLRFFLCLLIWNIPNIRLGCCSVANIFPQTCRFKTE